MNKLFFLYSLKINKCLNFSSTDSEEKWNAVWAAFEDSFLWGEFNIIMFTNYMITYMYQWLSFELYDELLKLCEFLFLRSSMAGPWMRLSSKLDWKIIVSHQSKRISFDNLLIHLINKVVYRTVQLYLGPV